jgi:hypothetical protein
MSRAASLRCRRLSLHPPGGTVVDSLKGGQGVGNKSSTPRAQGYEVIPGNRRHPDYRYPRVDGGVYEVIPGGQPHPDYRYPRDPRYDQGRRDHRDHQGRQDHRDHQGRQDHRDHQGRQGHRAPPPQRSGSRAISDNGGKWKWQKEEWQKKAANAREDHPGGRSLTKDNLWLQGALEQVEAQERERERERERRRAAKALEWERQRAAEARAPAPAGARGRDRRTRIAEHEKKGRDRQAARVIECDPRDTVVVFYR